MTDEQAKNNLPTVEQCKEYMASVGWHFQYLSRPWYVFRSPNRRSWSGSSELTFTLTELRNATRYGF